MRLDVELAPGVPYNSSFHVPLLPPISSRVSGLISPETICLFGMLDEWGKSGYLASRLDLPNTSIYELVRVLKKESRIGL